MQSRVPPALRWLGGRAHAAGQPRACLLALLCAHSLLFWGPAACFPLEATPGVGQKGKSSWPSWSKHLRHGRQARQGLEGRKEEEEEQGNRATRSRPCPPFHSKRWAGDPAWPSGRGPSWRWAPAGEVPFPNLHRMAHPGFNSGPSCLCAFPAESNCTFSFFFFFNRAVVMMEILSSSFLREACLVS